MTPRQRFRLCTATACSAIMLSAATAPALAQEPGAAERMNFSGKLRMLSQRTAAAGCNLAAGVDVDGSRDALVAAQSEFTKILAALRDGDADLNIPSKEDDAQVLSAIEAVEASWSPVNTAISTLVSDSGNQAAYRLIDAQNMGLLKDAQALVVKIVDVYAEGTLADNLGTMIDVAGRQRMLSQKISKEACQIWSGDKTSETIAALKDTMALFESSQVALQEGNEEMRITPPPSDAIAASLGTVWEEWQTLQPMLANAVAGSAASTDDRAKTWSHLNTTLSSANTVVGQYTRFKEEKQLIEDLGATERVNFSGKLRMLSQRVAALSCNYGAGINADENLTALTAAQAEFNKISKALEFGDADLRIKGAETRRRPLETLANMQKEWGPISGAVDAIAQGGDVDANLSVIANGNMDLLSTAQLVASEINTAYSDPTAILQSDALLIDISGRQRMLTQKMSKEACLTWSGINADENAAALAKTMNLFEVSLGALRDGYPAAGLKPAPTPEIKAGLEDIMSDWAALKPVLEGAAARSKADEATRADALMRLNGALTEMNAVVGLYTAFAKTGL